ncbi:hypothetical protein BC332_11067 [Capsicum chinense]|nr:hypothetical protein BC332_11067 [Capsicum chinense]
MRHRRGTPLNANVTIGATRRYRDDPLEKEEHEIAHRRDAMLITMARWKMTNVNLAITVKRPYRVGPLFYYKNIITSHPSIGFGKKWSGHAVYTRALRSVHAVYTRALRSVHGAYTRALRSVHAVYTRALRSVHAVYTRALRSVHAVYTRTLKSVIFLQG